MAPTVSRRTFLAGLAATAASCSTTLQKQSTVPLTIRYTGLIHFQHDTSSTPPAMKVGLLGNGHRTFVIVEVADVDIDPAAVKNPTDDQLTDWHPEGLSTNTTDLHIWDCSKFGLKVDSSDVLKVNAPFGVFPLARLAKKPGELDTGNTQSLLTFSSGTFSGYKRPHPTCEHEKAEWQMIAGPTDTTPVESKVYLVDTVEQTLEVNSASLSIDGVDFNFKTTGEIKVWVMQHMDPPPADPLDPKEIAHCQHYYDLVPGYGSANRYYPRRDGNLPTGCQDAWPIYCTPSEN